MSRACGRGRHEFSLAMCVNKRVDTTYLFGSAKVVQQPLLFLRVIEIVVLRKRLFQSLRRSNRQLFLAGVSSIQIYFLLFEGTLLEGVVTNHIDGGFSGPIALT